MGLTELSTDQTPVIRLAAKSTDGLDVLRAAQDALGEITGQITPDEPDELLGKTFGSFYREMNLQ